MLTHVLDGFGPVLVGEQSVRFTCNCDRERVLGALVALGQEEIRDLLHKDGHALVTCEFCNEQYTVGREELEMLLTEP
jgi:molecular chaperone Hsp33